MALITWIATALLFVPLSHGYTIKRIECTSNPSVCMDKFCHFNFTSEEPKEFHIFFGCKLKETITKLSLRIGSSFRVGKQYVALRTLDTMIDLCDIAQITSNSVLQTFAPQIVKEFTKILPGCPYKDEFSVTNLVLRGTSLPNLTGNKEIKSDLVFSKGKFLPMLTITLHGIGN